MGMLIREFLHNKRTKVSGMLISRRIPTIGVGLYWYVMTTSTGPAPEHPDGGTYLGALILVTWGLVSLGLSSLVTINHNPT